jgi:hypothetical protein
MFLLWIYPEKIILIVGGFTNMANGDSENNQFHQILEDDISNLNVGLLTFTVRINNGVVSDYILIKYDKKLGISQTGGAGNQAA